MNYLLILIFASTELVVSTGFIVHNADLASTFDSDEIRKCHTIRSFSVSADEGSRLPHCERTVKIFYKVEIVTKDNKTLKDSSSYLQEHGFLTDKILPKDHCLRTKTYLFAFFLINKNIYIK
jgi:hypothetical protein